MPALLHRSAGWQGIPLCRGSQACPPMAGYMWRRGSELCLKLGMTETAIEAAIEAVGAAEHYGTAREAWNVLLKASELDPISVWNGVAALLEDPAKAYRVALEMQQGGILAHIPTEVIMDSVGSDPQKALWAALMCNVHEAPLNELARQLLIRFGPASSGARELAARAHSTPGLVTSLAGFAETQLANALEWAKDPNPSVSEWGERMVRELRESQEYHAAREEFEEEEWR